MEDNKMPYMSAKEAVRAMEWARANGHTEEEAIELVEYITGMTPPNEKEDKKPKTKE